MVSKVPTTASVMYSQATRTVLKITASLLARSRYSSPAKFDNNSPGDL